MTDVKISLNDPSDILPFDNLYHTSSTSWVNWYNQMSSSADSFDTENINSLENNLPLYIQQSSDYGDFKKFLSLIGEHFDLIKSNIDSVGTIHKRNYGKTNSTPNNLLPILLDNMGWESLNPFTGSLASYFGQFLSSQTTIKDISETTWLKSLNNLVYLYKSKGTQNSVRALMNIYGYPPDVIGISEFGGSTLPPNDHPISPDVPNTGISH